MGAAVALLVAAGGLGYLLILKKPAGGPATSTQSGAAGGPATARNTPTLPAPGPTITRTSKNPGREGGSRGSSGAGAGSASGAAGLGEVPAPGARLDRAAAVAALAELRTALGTGDYDKLAYAESRLRSYIAGDEARALELLDMFKAETDPGVLAVLAGVLASDSAATGSAALANAMAALAENAGAAGPQREQALVFLAQSTAAPGEVDKRIAEMAKEGDPAFRQAALAALSSRANSVAPERAAELTALLLQTLRGERDPEMRAVFMAGVPLREASATAVGEVVDAMRRDTASGVREAAAHALGDAPASQRQQVVEELERSFRSEGDLGTRRAMLISMIRQVGPNALGAIERVRPIAGAAQPDCDDYIAVIRSGETQADRIFELKFGREMARGGPADAEEHHD